MDILSPINHESEVDPLREAGATELYCGLMRQEVLDKYTNVFSLNSRHVSEANLSGFDDLRALVAKAHASDMKVFVTYNALYSSVQFETLVDEVAQTIDCGVDGLIVADVSLMMHLKDKHPGVAVIVSTLGGSFNSRTCRLYAGLGAKRITLPRHLTLDEIAQIAGACPDIDFEVFVMSERCYFPNALCNFSHATYRVGHGFLPAAASAARTLLGRRAAFLTGTYNNQAVNALQDRFVAHSGMQCLRRYEADLLDAEGNALETDLEFRFMDIWNNFREACGLCALYDIARIENVCSVKIVGRQSLTRKKSADNSMVRAALDLLEDAPSRGEFNRAVRSVRKQYYPHYCGSAYCYYKQPTREKWV